MVSRLVLFELLKSKHAHKKTFAGLDDKKILENSQTPKQLKNNRMRLCKTKGKYPSKSAAITEPKAPPRNMPSKYGFSPFNI
jgi:hypothetical protein